MLPLAAAPLPPPGTDSVIASTDSADLKKTYLRLLPPAQIIEICLLFEPHVPPHIKSALWPDDLDAAIRALKESPSTSSKTSPDALAGGPPIPDAPNATLNGDSAPHQVHPPGNDPSATTATQPVASLNFKPPNGGEPSTPATEHVSAPPETPSGPPAVERTGTSVAGVTQSSDPKPSPTPAPGSHGSTPQPSQHAHLYPPPYPYPPYSYGMPPQPHGQQAPYAQTPYYPPPHGYPAHYPYPPYPPSGYPPHPPNAATPPVPGYPPGHMAHPPIPPQPPAPPPPAEELPSYEEMIVEALLDCGDSEGAAPKDLFTWMAARYPLQTNFRPSASQALQKAFRRGRFEKRPGGKYRLNAAWEGGATSKRTTRRPQNMNAVHTKLPPEAPFTTSPLTKAPYPPGAYPGYPYPYPPPYGAYPGYPPAAPAAAAAAKPDPPPPPPPPAKPPEEKEEAGDAWEAAQHILNAINFRSLELAGGSSSSSTAEAELSAMLGSLAAAAAASSSTSAEPARTTLTDEERTSLQAQLALLGAQLAEIADAEEEEEDAQMAPAASAPTETNAGGAGWQPPQLAPTVPVAAAPPPPVTAGTFVLDVNQFPDAFGVAGGGSVDATAMDAGAGTEDDDDDMEDVVMPLPVQRGGVALRT